MTSHNCFPFIYSFATRFTSRFADSLSDFSTFNQVQLQQAIQVTNFNPWSFLANLPSSEEIIFQQFVPSSFTL